MKRALLYFAAFFAVGFLVAAEIRNPGFESGRKSFEGIGWWWFSTTDSCDFDSENVHSGKRAVRLSVDDSTTQKANPYWSRYATLAGPVHEAKANTIYTIRCFIKTEMSEGQAGIAVVCQKKKMQMAERVPVKFLPVNKNTDWVELVYTFKTPEDLSEVTLFCALENFTGQAWFDDFSIQEGPDVPAIPQSDRWENALVLNPFVLIGEEAAERRLPVAQTELRLRSTGDHLLIRGSCFEPEMGKIEISAAGRDTAVWQDDSVEIFVDAQRSRSSYYQFIINANGAMYDARGGDAGWSPADIRLSAVKEKDYWTFELVIPYTAIGYGPTEAALPDKPMGFAVFRSRKTAVFSERSSWQLWLQKGNFANPALFVPILAGSGTQGKTFHFLTRGQAEDSMRPPLAWQLDDPLYEELMTSQPLHRATGTILNIGFRGNGLSVGETAFALQHGMKKHYAETNALMQKMRSVYNSTSVPPKERLLQYDQKIGAMPMIQFGGAHYQHAFRPDAPMFKHFAGAFFYPDTRVQETYAKHVKALLENNLDVIDEITLGHEGRFLYFSREYYDAIRKTYIENDPKTWNQMEDQAKRKYGHGKTGFPVSHESATPLERMVFQRFVFAEYNKGIHRLAAELRQIKPDIRLISELDPDGVKPYFYEQSVGAYDLMCQQMPWGHGSNRQSVAFHCKFLTDLAETPARGGPHIEHYFVSLNPVEVNEVISSIFRAGGTSLQLWLNDWFGKTLGDYYGAPERLHEIVSICQHIASMRKLNFPEADTAILYSNINQTARSWALTGGVGGGHEEAFTVLGPRIRTWFKFLSDTQLELGRASCSDFKVIYDPGSQYFPEDIYIKLLDYVKNGGKLVVADPLSYSLRTDGSKRDTTALLGVSTAEEIPVPGEMSFMQHPDFPECSRRGVLVTGAARRLQPVSPATSALATYPDGTVALAIHKLGRGQVITFASTPFNSTLYGSKTWWDFFRAFQIDLGCKVDQKIWRFRFPLAQTELPPRVPEALYCLTGNSWYYVADAPVEGSNVNLPFSVSYSLPPDHIADHAEPGKLFNRKASMTANSLHQTARLDGAVDPWVVAWKPGLASSIRLTFTKIVTVQKVRFWVHNAPPEFTFGAVVNGIFQEAGKVSAPSCQEGDVREMEMDFPVIQSDAFELRFGERPNDILYFAELELWGNP